MERSEIKAIMVEALQEHYGDHSAHHAWIQARIESEEQKRDFLLGMTKTVAQWSITGLLGFMVYWIQDHWH